MGDDRGAGAEGQEEALEAYERILARFRTIREHAEKGEWDAVIEQHSTYLAEWTHLNYLEARGDTSSGSATHKTVLMRQVLEESAEIQRHLTARRDEIGQIILEASERQSASASYSAIERLNPDSKDS